MTSSRNESASKVAEALSVLVQALVKNISGVTVTAVVRGNIVAASIKVDKEDRSRVLGKEGRHFAALQRIARECARGLDSWVVLDETTSQETPSVENRLANAPMDVTAVVRHALAAIVRNPELLAVDTTNLGSASLIEVRMSAMDEGRFKGDPDYCDPFDPSGTVEEAIGRLVHAVAVSRGRTVKLAIFSVALA
jgi:predicted RNA-binding protein YlqC (UPF0109 family)